MGFWALTTPLLRSSRQQTDPPIIEGVELPQHGHRSSAITNISDLPETHPIGPLELMMKCTWKTSQERIMKTWKTGSRLTPHDHLRSGDKHDLAHRYSRPSRKNDTFAGRSHSTGQRFLRRPSISSEAKIALARTAKHHIEQVVDLFESEYSYRHHRINQI